MSHNGNDNEANYKLDETKKPKEMTVTHDGKTMLGIYKLEGDKLTVCIANEDDNTRPTEFVSKDGTQTMLIVMKREKK
jgi:uncharacterized protein (TIGR03067 family)